MRIGELLLEATIIDAKSLEKALDYHSSKSVPLGRALRAMKFLEEADLDRGLDAQMAIRKGLDPKVAVPILRYAHQTNRTFLQALKQWAGLVGKEKIPDAVFDMLNEKSLETTAVRQKPKLESVSPAAAPPQQPAPPKPTAPQPVSSAQASAEKSAEALIKEADTLFAANKVIPAQRAYDMARRQLEDDYGTPPSKLAQLLVKLGNLYLTTEQFSRADMTLTRVLELQTKVFGRNSPEVAGVIESLGDLELMRSSHAMAARRLGEALDVVEQMPATDIILAGRILKKMMSIPTPESTQQIRLGELAVDAGLLNQQQVATSLEKSQKSGKPLGIVFREDQLLSTQQVESVIFAQLLIQQNTLPRSVAIRAIKYASSKKIPLRHLSEGGLWMPPLDESDDAFRDLVLAQEGLIAVELSRGYDHPDLVPLIGKLGDLRMVRKDRGMAEYLYKRAATILQNAPNGDKLQMAQIAEKLAVAYWQQGKFNDAQPALLKSLEYRDQAGAGASSEAAKCYWLVARLEVGRSNFATALTFFDHAKKTFDNLEGTECPQKLLDEMAECAENAGVAH